MGSFKENELKAEDTSKETDEWLKKEKQKKAFPQQEFRWPRTRTYKTVTGKYDSRGYWSDYYQWGSF